MLSSIEKFVTEMMGNIAHEIVEGNVKGETQEEVLKDLLRIINIPTPRFTVIPVGKQPAAVAAKPKRKKVEAAPKMKIGVERWFDKDNTPQGKCCTYVSPAQVGGKTFEHSNRMCGIQDELVETDKGPRCKFCFTCSKRTNELVPKTDLYFKKWFQAENGSDEEQPAEQPAEQPKPKKKAKAEKKPAKKAAKKPAKKAAKKPEPDMEEQVEAMEEQLEANEAKIQKLEKQHSELKAKAEAKKKLEEECFGEDTEDDEANDEYDPDASSDEFVESEDETDEEDN